MTASEHNRQFYLQSAGIRMWYAKRPLPGAAPSHEFDLVDIGPMVEPAFADKSMATGSSSVELMPSETSTRNRSVDLQSLMAPADQRTGHARKPEPSVRGDSGGGEAIASEIEPATKPANSTKTQDLPGESPGEPPREVSAGPVIAVHLGIWSTERYLLISQWSEEASERLQDSLARNLLKALEQSEFDERRMLHWPVFRNPRIPGNSVDDFRGVLGRMLASEADRSIILMGVLTNEANEHRQRCLNPILPSVGVDFPFSLAELSAASTHKRDLWNLLKTRFPV